MGNRWWVKKLCPIFKDAYQEDKYAELEKFIKEIEDTAAKTGITHRKYAGFNESKSFQKFKEHIIQLKKDKNNGKNN